MKPYGIKVTHVLPGAAYTDSWSGSGIDPHWLMEASDIAEMVYAAARLAAGLRGGDHPAPNWAISERLSFNKLFDRSTAKITGAIGNTLFLGSSIMRSLLHK